MEIETEMKMKLKKIISYYKPYRQMLLKNLFATSLASLVATAIPLVCNHVTNSFYSQKSDIMRVIFLSIMSISLLLLTRYCCNRYSFHSGSLFATKIEVDIKNELFEHFQKQDLSFFDERSTGKLMTSITNDAYSISNIVKKVPEIILDILIKYTGTFIFLFRTSVILAFTLMILYIFLFIFMFKSFDSIQRINGEAREVFSDLSGNLEENISGIRVIKSFTNENLSIKNFREKNERYLDIKDRMYKKESQFFSLFITFIVSMHPMITTVGTILAVKGLLHMNQIILLLLYVNILEWPLWDIIHISDFLKDGIVGFNRILKMLRINPRITNKENPIRPKVLRGDIEFKDVSFMYKSSKSGIFSDLNLKINSGDYIALVGSSGSGKSTLCNLIPRFYEVIDGAILIDGINIKDIELKNLRDNIGFVHQESVLFSGTIYQNIVYGKLDASEEEVIEAAKNAYAHEFIMDLPDGYQTSIGRNGTKLSGGQKQRISISRVFLKNPPILIFDEATSALDNESERFIQKSMEKLAKGRTTIVIAHRLSTIKNAQRILVVDHGQIVEEGTHEELISQNGAYKKLYELL